MYTYYLYKLKVNQTIFNDEKYKLLFSVDVFNDLVQKGIPFRDAYKMVGKDIQDGNFNPAKVVNHSHIGSIGNLCLAEIIEKKNRT